GRPGEPGYENCQWVKLQLFIPSVDLQNYCEIRTVGDRWRWSGTIERSLISDPRTMDAMRRAAQNRWELSKAKDVPDAEWRRFAADLPKLCLRTVDRDGRPFVDRDGAPILDHRGNPKSKWLEKGVIPAVWCDY